MIGDLLFACCSAGELMYEIRSYRGHVFRWYPGGEIGKANQQEKEIASKK